MRPRRPRISGLVLLAALLASLFPFRAAQAAAPPASPLLPPDHWAVKAASRLHEAGLAPDWFPAQRAVPLLAVGQALSAAAAREGADPAAINLARAWAARFAREFPGAAGAGGGEVALAGASAGVGFTVGHASPSVAPSSAPSRLLLEASGDDPVADLSAAALLGDHLAAGARLHARPWQIEAQALEVVAALGPVSLSLGRAPLGHGPGEVGGVVLSGAAALDRVELQTTDPFRLPWALAALGDFQVDVALARLDEDRHPYHPLLWTFDLQWRPHPRLTLGAIRGLMFGGTPWNGIEAWRVPLVLFGAANYRENNVNSGSVHWRLPTEALLPLTARLELGTDDEPKAAFSWPGLVVGLSAPMLPGLPAAVGLEYAYFGKGPVGYHDPFGWYTHGQYVGGWATGQTPLGDPLGGNGRALRATASADLLEARLRLFAVAWVQDRTAENLYAPAAGGQSVGGRGEAELRLGRLAVQARGAYERGRGGWSRGELSVVATAFF